MNVLHRAAALIVAVMLVSLPARAVVVTSPQWSATYVAAYNPLFTGGVPYSGEMKLHFNHGVISGTYRGMSVRPDPLQGRIVPVNGTTSHARISLRVGGSDGFTITNGTLASNGTISGTAVQRGNMYSFLAKVKSSP